MERHQTIWPESILLENDKNIQCHETAMFAKDSLKLKKTFLLRKEMIFTSLTKPKMSFTFSIFDLIYDLPNFFSFIFYLFEHLLWLPRICLTFSPRLHTNVLGQSLSNNRPLLFIGTNFFACLFIYCWRTLNFHQRWFWNNLGDIFLRLK